jgi:hypothetical protein
MTKKLGRCTYAPRRPSDTRATRAAGQPHPETSVIGRASPPGRSRPRRADPVARRARMAGGPLGPRRRIRPRSVRLGTRSPTSPALCSSAGGRTGMAARCWWAGTATSLSCTRCSATVHRARAGGTPALSSALIRSSCGACLPAPRARRSRPFSAASGSGRAGAARGRDRRRGARPQREPRRRPTFPPVPHATACVPLRIAVAISYSRPRSTVGCSLSPG